MTVMLSPSQRSNPFVSLNYMPLPIAGVFQIGEKILETLGLLVIISFATPAHDAGPGCANSPSGNNQRQDGGVPINPATWVDGGFSTGIPEICANGVDDDLNRITDVEECYVPESCQVSEGGTSRAYYTGETGREGNSYLGICRPGSEVCMVEPDSERAYWIRTTFDVTPFDEICDELDNNCDGLIDEDRDTSIDAGASDFGAPDVGVPDISTSIPDVGIPDVAIPIPDIGIPDVGIPDTGVDAEIVCVPEDEICDGIDNNCNGEVDEPHKIGEDIRVTDTLGQSRMPALIWNGAEFIISWEESSDVSAGIYFTRLNREGSIIDSNVRVTGLHSGGGGWARPIVWNGSGYGIVWQDWTPTSDLFFALLDLSGSIRGEITELTNGNPGSWAPSLVFTGEEYALSYVCDANFIHNSKICFSRVDLLRDEIGDEVRLADGYELMRNTEIVFNGSGYGVTWQQNDEFGGINENLSFMRIDDEGGRIGEELLITDTSFGHIPTIVWTDSEYGLSWSDTRDYGGLNADVYFVRINSDGIKIGSDIRITNEVAGSPFLVWRGSKYGLIWGDARNSFSQLYFVQLDRFGVKESNDVRIVNTFFHAETPSLAWTGSEYGAAWGDYRHGDGNIEIYFARIGVCE